MLQLLHFQKRRGARNKHDKIKSWSHWFRGSSTNSSFANFEQLSSKYQISALCDISEQLLETLGEQYRVENLYTDAIELTKQEDLDVVFVLNSDEYHTDCVVAAAENKKHVLVEKPMCLTLADADKIIEARDKNNVQVMVGYMRRFAPAFIEGIEEVKKWRK